MTALRQLLSEHIEIWTAADTEKKTGRGRASGSATSLYGIKKLRNLILELAVRGKLVPQDTSDEPASELLKRIQIERNRLVVDGFVKKSTQAPLITENEKPFALPTRWTWARLSSCSKQITDGEHLTPERTTDSSQVALVTAKNVRDGSMDYTATDFVSFEVAKKCWSRCKPEINDILIVSVGATIGRLTILEDYRDMVIVRSVTLVKPLIIDVKYLALALRSPPLQQKIWAGVKQNAQPCLYLSVSSNIPIPIPPLAEQHRIVAKVDELMTLCDQLEAQHSNAADAHEQLVSHLLSTLAEPQSTPEFNANWERIAAHFDTLFTTEASIVVLKQTLLQLAVMGKLVAQDANDKPASELLKRIRAEKVKLVSEGKIKNRKAFPEILNGKQISAAPSGWEKVNFGEIVELISGQHLSPGEYFEEEDIDSIPYITGPADFSDNGPIPNRHTRERRAIATRGDILVTVKGSGIGKTNSVHQNELAISRQLMAVRPILVDVSFVDMLLLTLAQVFRNSIVGIAIPGISREDILYAQIALPPLAEQIRIVAKIDELMVMCDQLRTSIISTSQRQIKLADVLVEHAVIG